MMELVILKTTNGPIVVGVAPFRLVDKMAKHMLVFGKGPQAIWSRAWGLSSLRAELVLNSFAISISSHIFVDGLHLSFSSFNRCIRVRFKRKIRFYQFHGMDS